MILYEPTVDVSTDPEVVTGVEPWLASFAVAPASVYAEPSSTVTDALPFKEITGATSSLYPLDVESRTRPIPNADNAFSSTLILIRANLNLSDNFLLSEGLCVSFCFASKAEISLLKSSFSDKTSLWDIKSTFWV